YNNAPVATGASYSILHDTTLTGEVYGYDLDGDAITAHLISEPNHGTVILDPHGGFTYTPYAGYVGTDLFTFMWFDGVSQSSVGSIYIEIYNHAPTTTDDIFELWPGECWSGNLLANDFDADDDPMQVVAVNGQTFEGETLLATPFGGWLSITRDGSLSYEPGPNDQPGEMIFDYTLSDGIEPWPAENNVGPHGNVRIVMQAPRKLNLELTRWESDVLFRPSLTNGIINSGQRPEALNNDNARGKINFVSMQITVLGRMVQGQKVYVDYVFDVNTTGGTTEFRFEYGVGNNTGRPWRSVEFQLGFFTGPRFWRSAEGDQLDFDLPHRDDWPYEGTEFLVKYASFPDGTKNYQVWTSGDFRYFEDQLVWDGRGQGEVPDERNAVFWFNIDIPDFVPNLMHEHAKTNRGYEFTLRLVIEAG
ncbi:MAG: Ig-like domain-containing protein, partial [Candidatus Caldarchaeum sp.]